jgi:hypothetical protein
MSQLTLAEQLMQSGVNAKDWKFKYVPMFICNPQLLFSSTYILTYIIVIFKIEASLISLRIIYALGITYRNTRVTKVLLT